MSEEAAEETEPMSPKQLEEGILLAHVRLDRLEQILAPAVAGNRRDRREAGSKAARNKRKAERRARRAGR